MGYAFGGGFAGWHRDFDPSCGVSTMKNWPNDVDGDVLRNMEERGFDFSKPASIDFNVDFETWPPAKRAVNVLARQYPDLEIHEPEGEFAGEITFQVSDRVTYELVMRIQREVTKLMVPFGGRCESWGVLQETPVTRSSS